jgi:hypothetical protein
MVEKIADKKEKAEKNGVKSRPDVLIPSKPVHRQHRDKLQHLHGNQQIVFFEKKLHSSPAFTQDIFKR